MLGPQWRRPGRRAPRDRRGGAGSRCRASPLGTFPRGGPEPERRLVRPPCRRGARHRGARGPGTGQLFDILSGQTRPGAGEVLVDGSPVQLRHPADAIREGIVLVPADGRRRCSCSDPCARTSACRGSPRCGWGWSTPARRDAEWRRDRPAADRHPRAVGGKAPVGRQPAEGHDRAVAGERRADVPVLRPDARDRHRDETRNLPARPRACGSRRRGAAPDVRARGDPAGLRSAIVIYGGQVMDELPAARADEPTLLRAAHGLPVAAGDAA